MPGSPVVARWDDPSSDADVIAGGRSGLAWELLRRDPAYRAAVAALHGGAGGAADPAFVAHWGLHFR